MKTGSSFSLSLALVTISLTKYSALAAFQVSQVATPNLPSNKPRATIEKPLLQE